MKYQHKIIAVLALSLLGCWQATNAQPLENLLAAADSANLELKALYQDYLAALEKGPQVSQLPEPEAGLGVFPLPVETRLGPQWVRLSATQMFPWKGTLKAREDVVLAMAKAQYEKIAASRLNLHYQVKQAYFQLYELDERRQILKKSIDIFRTLESIATTRVEAGKANLADVLRIQIRIRNLEEELNILENQKKNPLAVINRLLNRPEQSPVTIADTLPLAEPPYERAALLNDIQEGHPMLRMYALQQEAAQRVIELNELEGKPSFGVGLDYIAVGRRSDANPVNNGRDILSPRVGVRIPLYREKYRAKEQEEKLKIQALETRKQDLFLQFRSAIEQAYASLEDGRIKYRLYQEQKATTRSAIELLLAAYSNDGASFIDLLQLEDQLVQYDLMALSAVVKTQEAQAEVERYIP
ncbi:MAG: TolC family protein [Lewinellaceae bacterium]|nr:TolC family protein [Lewinellaceae bacterium]MCB9289374.1 TolC family protein [Lewinellaceae bacterium]